MPDYDPAGLASSRNQARAAVRDAVTSVLPAAGLSKCGAGATVTDGDLDQRTGYWGAGKTSKPPRWLFELGVSDGEVTARALEHDRADQLGYYSTTATANARLRTLEARAIPVVQASGAYRLLQEWEWVLYVVLSESPQKNSSADIASGFKPPFGPNTRIQINGATIRPLSILLAELRDGTDTIEVAGESITYRAASNALRRLFRIIQPDPDGGDAPSVSSPDGDD